MVGDWRLTVLHPMRRGDPEEETKSMIKTCHNSAISSYILSNHKLEYNSRLYIQYKFKRNLSQGS